MAGQDIAYRTKIEERRLAGCIFAGAACGFNNGAELTLVELLGLLVDVDLPIALFGGAEAINVLMLPKVEVGKLMQMGVQGGYRRGEPGADEI